MDIEKAIDELVVEVRKDNSFLNKIKVQAWKFKKRYNPGMMEFPEWLREIWARQTVRTAVESGLAYSTELAMDIGKIEYYGVPALMAVVNMYADSDCWSCYVEEGRINATVYCKDRSIAEKAADMLRRLTWEEVEIVDDYDDEIVPVMASLPYKGMHDVRRKRVSF